METPYFVSHGEMFREFSKGMSRERDRGCRNHHVGLSLQVDSVAVVIWATELNCTPVISCN